VLTPADPDLFEATPALVGHVLDDCGPLVTGTAEHLVHALTRDAERTDKLGLAPQRLP
jgi:hypothetical protein